MTIMYLCFLAGGSVLPFISVIFGFFGDGIDTDIDADFSADINTDINTELDVGAGVDAGADYDIGAGLGSSFSLGLWPSSLMSISAMAIAFGAVGGIMSYTGKGKLITFVVAFVCGYVASVIMQTIVKSLKKIQRRNYGTKENELLLYEGKIVDTILPGQLGTVSFTTLSGGSD